eukprot:49141-Heterocapsa_arctica.AAC.1
MSFGSWPWRFRLPVLSSCAMPCGCRRAFSGCCAMGHQQLEQSSDEFKSRGDLNNVHKHPHSRTFTNAAREH